MNKITPVILCGGSGTRLWPLSRSGFPKQFLVLSGTNSLFQQALERLSAIASDDIAVGETLVVTNEEHRFCCVPDVKFAEMVHEMASTDLTEAKKHALLKQHGYNIAMSLE